MLLNDIAKRHIFSDVDWWADKKSSVFVVCVRKTTWSSKNFEGVSKKRDRNKKKGMDIMISVIIAFFEGSDDGDFLYLFSHDL